MSAGFEEIGTNAIVKGAEAFIADINRMQRSIDGFNASNRKLSTANFNATKSFDSLTTSIGNFGRKALSIGNQVSNLGFRLSFLLTAPIVLGARELVNASGTFEEELLKVQNLVGVNEQQVSSWGDEILKLGPALGALPTELAEGLFTITSAGIRDQVGTMAALESAAKGAAIGLGEIKDIGRLTAATTQAYGEANLDAARSTEILMAIVREGNVDAASLSKTLGRTIPQAAQLGVSFEEVGAYIATFTRLGVPAEVSVTSLRAALSSIIKPTSQATNTLAEYGISMEQVRDAIADPSIGLGRVLIALTTVFGGSSEELANVIGNVRGLTGVLAVTGDAMQETYGEVKASIEGSVGAIDEAFARLEGTTIFTMKQVKAELQSMAIEVGDLVAPAFRDILVNVRAAINIFRAFAEASPEVVNQFIKIAIAAAIIPPVIIAIGTLISSLGTIVVFVGGALSAFGSIIGGIAGILSSLFLPALGAIIGSVLVFGDKATDAFSNVAEETGDFFTNFAKTAKSWGKNISEQFGVGIIEGATAVVQALTTLGSIIADFLRPGSPPKLLPDLDDWGRIAAQVWIDGWGSADFSVFDSIARTVEGFLRSVFVPDEETAGDLDRIILEARQSIADLVSEFAQTGKVGESAINDFLNSLAYATPELERYIDAMFRAEIASQALADAQQRVNDLTASFEAAVAPIDARLQEIADIRQGVVDTKRLEALRKILEDETAPELAKELAALEIEEIELRQQRRGLEIENEEQLSIAEQQLAEAQAAYDVANEQLQVALSTVELQTETNSLLASMLEELKNLDVSASLNVAGAGEGVSGIDGDALSEALSGLGDWGIGGSGIEEATEGAEEAIGAFEEVVSDLQRRIGNFLWAVDDLKAAIADVGLALRERFIAIGESLGIDLLFEKIGELTGGFSLEGAVGVWGRFLEISSMVQEKMSLFKQTLDEVRGYLVSEFGESWADIQETIEVHFLPLWDSLNESFQSSKPVLDELVAAWQVGFRYMALFVTSFIGGVINGVNTLLTGFAWIIEGVATMAEGFYTIIGGIGDVVKGFFNDSREEILDGLLRMAGGVMLILEGLGYTIVGLITSTVGTVIDIIVEWVKNFIEYFQKIYDEIVGNSIIPDLVNEIIEWINTLAIDLIAKVVEMVDSFIGEVVRMAQEAMDTILETDWLSVGKDIIEGIAQGVSNNAGQLYGRLEAMAAEAWQRVKDYFGISSPSRLAIETAENIVSSFAMPFEEMEPVRLPYSLMAPVDVAPQAAAGVGGYNQSRNVNISFGDISISNGQDMTQFERRVRQVVYEAIR